MGKLVYRPNILGDDQRITNTGGGNMSSKLQETDPLTGEMVKVLWGKGSGGDLRTSKRENFSSLYMDKLRSLITNYNNAEVKGVKTLIEDEMVVMNNTRRSTSTHTHRALTRHCTLLSLRLM